MAPGRRLPPLSSRATAWCSRKPIRRNGFEAAGSLPPFLPEEDVMHRPVRVTPPAIQPVTLAEAKLHLRVDHDDEDALISNLIQAATGHLDGWTGILGHCLVEQVWRQDHDRFARELVIPLGPVLSVQTVTWRDPAGLLNTVPSTAYDLCVDLAGSARIRFDPDYHFPTDLHESRAVAITCKAGYAND